MYLSICTLFFYISKGNRSSAFSIKARAHLAVGIRSSRPGFFLLLKKYINHFLADFPLRYTTKLVTLYIYLKTTIIETYIGVWASPHLEIVCPALPAAKVKEHVPYVDFVAECMRNRWRIAHHRRIPPLLCAMYSIGLSLFFLYVFLLYWQRRACNNKDVTAQMPVESFPIELIPSISNDTTMEVNSLSPISKRVLYHEVEHHDFFGLILYRCGI